MRGREWAVGPYIAFMPSEFLRFRLGYKHTERADAATASPTTSRAPGRWTRSSSRPRSSWAPTRRIRSRLDEETIMTMRTLARTLSPLLLASVAGLGAGAAEAAYKIRGGGDHHRPQGPGRGGRRRPRGGRRPRPRQPEPARPRGAAEPHGQGPPGRPARHERPRARPVGRGGRAGRQQSPSGARRARGASMPPPASSCSRCPRPGSTARWATCTRSAIPTTRSTRHGAGRHRQHPRGAGAGRAAVAPAFERNREAFLARLDQAMRRWTAALAPFKGAKVVVDHNMWLYFLTRFGLVEAGSVEERPGIPPTPSHLTRLIALMKDQKVRVDPVGAVERPEARGAGAPRRPARRSSRWRPGWARSRAPTATWRRSTTMSGASRRRSSDAGRAEGTVTT